MKRLIGITALATLGLSYSVQAAVEPDPVEEPVPVVEPELEVWTGDTKDHIGYGPVVEVAVIVDLVRVERSCMGTDLDNPCFVLETPSAPVRPCVSGFANRMPC